MISYSSDSNYTNEKQRILIVEDEAIVALDIQGRLKALGYSIAGVASTGERAIELAKQKILTLSLWTLCWKGIWTVLIQLQQSKMKLTCL